MNHPRQTRQQRQQRRGGVFAPLERCSPSPSSACPHSQKGTYSHTDNTPENHIISKEPKQEDKKKKSRLHDMKKEKKESCGGIFSPSQHSVAPCGRRTVASQEISASAVFFSTKARSDSESVPFSDAPTRGYSPVPSLCTLAMGRAAAAAAAFHTHKHQYIRDGG